MNKRIKKEAANLTVPQSKAQTEDFIAEIGRLQRERQRIETAMNDELATIKQKFEAQAQPLGEKIRQITDGVQIWCEANRAALTNQDKTKTAGLASGEVKWRTRPPKVSVRNTVKVIETLKGLRLKRFLRTKEEIDKEAILADPKAIEGIQGLSISQGEDFVIVPFETELEEVA